MASVTLGELRGDVPSMLVLYVLGKMGDGALGETQFQMALFRTMLILGIDPVQAGYRPSFLGPFSDLLSDTRDGLMDIGYLKETTRGVKVSAEERTAVSTIRISGHDVDLEVEHMVDYVSGLSRDETLLIAFCDDERRTGGMFIDESNVRRDIYRNRIPIAAGLYRKGKVSMDRAAELAGMPLSGFLDEMMERYGCVDALRTLSVCPDPMPSMHPDERM